MKEEVLNKYKEGQEALLGELYDAAAADGAAGKEASGITQDQLDAAVNSAKEAGLAEGEKIGFDKGVASVPVPSEDGVFTQAEMDKYAQGKVDAAIAAIPADTTPYSEEQMNAVKAELEAAKAVSEQALRDDASDKDKIAALEAKVQSKDESLAKIDAILHPVEVQPQV